MMLVVSVSAQVHADTDAMRPCKFFEVDWSGKIGACSRVATCTDGGPETAGLGLCMFFFLAGRRVPSA